MEIENTEDAVSFKQWLFEENIRVENEKKELNEIYLKFIDEKKQFQEEMKILNSRVLSERKRLKEESLFFDKKMAILKGGFEQLDLDRKKFEKEKQLYENEMDQARERRKGIADSEMASLFFKGVNNPLTLKKRYKDLIKIFHPDNICGDTDTIQMINREYERLREEFEYYRHA